MEKLENKNVDKLIKKHQKEIEKLLIEKHSKTIAKMLSKYEINTPERTQALLNIFGEQIKAKIELIKDEENNIIMTNNIKKKSNKITTQI